MSDQLNSQVNDTNPADETLHIVAILEVKADEVDAFREFEQHAARIMFKHGGRITQTIILDQTNQHDPLKEVHIIKFPNSVAFDAYLEDPSIADKADLRQRSVISTQIFRGTSGPDYFTM